MVIGAGYTSSEVALSIMGLGSACELIKTPTRGLFYCGFRATIPELKGSNMEGG